MTVVRPLGLAVVLMMPSVVFSTPELLGAGTDVRGQMKMDKAEASSKTLVLIGASYAGGWLPDQPVAGYRVINKGVTGQQSYEMLARFENDVLTLKPDAVIIWGFINDVFRSDQMQIDQTLKRTRESMQAMVELAKKSGIVPILATEVTIRGKDEWKEVIGDLVGSLLGKTSYQDYVNRHVRETNRWIRELAAREQVQLLDFETVLADQQGVRRKELSKPDGSHISSRGYEVLTRYAEERLRVELRD
jgi:lysophospholipase L1-like esterase